VFSFLLSDFGCSGQETQLREDLFRKKHQNNFFQKMEYLLELVHLL